jgi:hypothetical protein
MLQLKNCNGVEKSTVLFGINFSSVHKKYFMIDKKNEDPVKEKSSAEETEQDQDNNKRKLKEQSAEATKRNNDEIEKTQQEQKETD